MLIRRNRNLFAGQLFSGIGTFRSSVRVHDFDKSPIVGTSMCPWRGTLLHLPSSHRDSCGRP